MPILLVDSLLKLIDKGIDLLRERERQRKLFFEEVVKPLEAVFEEMYLAHIATFKEVRGMILKSQDPSEIIALVNERIIFEQGTIELLFRLVSVDNHDDWRRAPSSDTLQIEFMAYVKSIAECLVSTTNEVRPSIVYYRGLHEAMQQLSIAATITLQ